MLANQSKLNIDLIRAACRATQGSPNLNLAQVRTAGIYNRSPRGPNKISNLDIDYIALTKDFFSHKGVKFVKDEAKRIYNKALRTTISEIRVPNKLKIFEHFDSDESIKAWKTNADSDSLNGFSISTFSRSQAGHGLFKGVIDTRVPDDGVSMQSGFAGVSGPAAPRDALFQIETFWNWQDWTTFEIRFRGDGRKYNVSLSTASYYNDLEFFDTQSYPLYTRGGPYWQTYQIPFSKFVFSNAGFIQDQQGFDPRRVKRVAITIQDSINGPFELEIDYIGLRFCYPIFDEKCAYEGYTFPHIKYKQLGLPCEPPDPSP